MTSILLLLQKSWPWYVAGPLIGMMVPALLLAGNKSFGISSNLRHLCAIVAPGQIAFFRYDWKRLGGWNLAFALGIVLGGVAAHRWLGAGQDIVLDPATRATLAQLGL